MFVYVVKKDTFACTASTCLVLRQRASVVQACRTTNQKNISVQTQKSNAMWPEAWITALVSMLAMGGSLSLSRSVQRRVRDPKLGVVYHLPLAFTAKVSFSLSSTYDRALRVLASGALRTWRGQIGTRPGPRETVDMGEDNILLMTMYVYQCFEAAVLTGRSLA